jgi:thioredoxin reductase (NADPH)
MAGKIIEINTEEYEQEVLKSGKVVVDFYSTECPPCEALASKYESLSNIYGDDIKFVKIFRQGNRDLATKLEVTSSPTLLFYEDGKCSDVKLSGGIKRKAIITELNKLLTEERVNEINKSIKPIVTKTNTLILGGGPAGLTAGIYLGQAHVDTILVDRALPGGYVSTTHQVSNYPGFVEPQAGMMLGHYFSEQAKNTGITFKVAVDIDSVDLKAKKVVIDEFETIEAENILVATGSSPRPLGIPGEFEFAGQGISYCATCDAKYFEDKHVIVIGGGNSAIEEALFIAKFASKITIVHQFDTLQANKMAQEKAFNDKKINFIFEAEPREFKKYGTYDMGCVIEHLKTGETEEVRGDGIFVFVGFIPNLDGFSEDLELDQWGYVKTDADMKTNLPKVYAAGDVATKKYRQITTAVAEGTVAAINISKDQD